MRLSLLSILGYAVLPSLQQGGGANFNTTPAYNEALQGVIKAYLNAKDCNGCYDILNVIKPVAEIGDIAIAQLTGQLCILLQKYSNAECIGTEILEAPSVSYALRSMDIPSRTAQLFCHSLLGLCDQPPVINYTVPIPKPKPAELTRPKPCGKKPIYVVHISDLHVDHDYTPGLSYNVSTQDRFTSLATTDVH